MKNVNFISEKVSYAHLLRIAIHTTGYLSLSENEIGGKLPQELAAMSKLALLFVDGNNFEGQLPKGIGTMTDLGTFIAAFVLLLFRFIQR